jgi:hypothetical protein
VVTPLTTLVAELVSAGQSVADAQTAVKAALNLAATVDLTTYDAVQAVANSDPNAAAVLAAGVQVQATIAQISAVAEAGTNVAAALADVISSASQPIDLGNADDMETIVAASGVTGDAATAVTSVAAAANTAIAEGATTGDPTAILTAVAKAATVALGETLTALSDAVASDDPAAALAQATSDFTGTNLTEKVDTATVGVVNSPIIGSIGNDNLAGTGNADAIDGLDGNDVISGDSGNDQIYGGAGNDFLLGGDDDDALDGGAGNDRALYTDATGGLTINLAAGTVSGAGVGTDTLQSIENVRGGNFADIYNAVGFNGASANAGSSGAVNSFEGMGGNDTITGNGSTVVYYQNAAAGVTVDLLAGTAQGTDAGDLAGIGTDTMTGILSIYGSAFNDTLLGSNTTTTVEFFVGNGGNDDIDGRGGLDRVNYAALLDDTVTGGVAIDLASGIVTGDASVGTDTLRGIEFIRGSQFADTFVATGFSGSSTNAGFNGTFNEFEGMAGNDTITGNGNTRLAFYNATSGVTVDIAAGTASGTSTGNDTFTGVNSIAGSQFADTLLGSNNVAGTSEQFEGRAGNDTFDGRGGFDQAVYSNDVSVTAGIDIDMAAGTVNGGAAIGTDTLLSIESVRGTNFADVYNATGFSGSSTNAGSSGTFNSIEGMGGNDTITGNGNTQISFFNATGGVTVNFLTGIATGNGSVGTDSFTFVNNVQGSNFADTVIGATGSQSFTGRGGDDLFVYANNGGFDTITDFVAGGTDDRIDLTGLYDVYDFARLQSLATQVGANTFINFGSGNSLTLNNVTKANLTASDFIFAANPAPTDLSLSVDTIDENAAAGTVIGQILTVDNPSDTYTFTPLDDAGGRFAINAGNLVVAGSLDYETATSHQVTVRVTDSGGNTYDKVLTVNVSNVNETPTDIALSANSVAENSAANTIVGALSATDPDIGDSASYTLIDDAGGRFAISGTNLVVAGSLDYETATSHQVTVRVTDGGGNSYDEVFTINVSNVSGSFTGTGAGETLTGTSEEDTIQALGGNDTLQGLAGNDILNGGVGNDRAVYTDASGGLTINLAAGTVSGAGVGTDTLQSVENIRGGNFADSFNAVGFSGTSTNAGSTGTVNSFEGMGGNDTITGNGSTVALYQNASAGVTVDLAAGTAQGTDAGDIAGVGNDTLSGVSAVSGSAFNDTLLGSNTTATVESFIGNGGNDLIDGRGGLDRANYAAILDDTVTGGISIDMASGIVTGDASVGTDTLRGIEFVRGSQFADTYVATGFSGSSANAGFNGTFNEFEGMGGNDIITGNGNTRLAFYNATSGVTVDIAAGTASGASIGNDTFTGVNSIAGSQSADTLYGSNNAAGTSEQFEGRAGNDTFDGRGGFDQAVYNNDVAVTSGIAIDMAAGTVTGGAAIGTDTLLSIESIRATNFNDTYVATGFSNSSTNAGSNGTFNDFEGMGGNDTITGNGNTRITFNNAGAGVTVNLLAGTASGTSTGNDTFTGVNQVRGSNFADTITGDANNNTLDGQGGTDTITGGAGNDTLTGGANADTFVFANGFGADIVTDFSQAQFDKIDLTGITGVYDLAGVQALASQVGANTVIDFGGGNTITLNGVTAASLLTSDFIFGTP